MVSPSQQVVISAFLRLGITWSANSVHPPPLKWTFGQQVLAPILPTLAIADSVPSFAFATSANVQLTNKAWWRLLLDETLLRPPRGGLYCEGGSETTQSAESTTGPKQPPPMRPNQTVAAGESTQSCSRRSWLPDNDQTFADVTSWSTWGLTRMPTNSWRHHGRAPCDIFFPCAGQLPSNPSPPSSAKSKLFDQQKHRDCLQQPPRIQVQK